MRIMQNNVWCVSRIYFNLLYERISIAAVTLLGIKKRPWLGVLEVSDRARDYMVYSANFDSQTQPSGIIG